jgi:hypothetical protein
MCPGRTNHALAHLSSLVKEFATDLMTGAAKSTIGTMVPQAASQDVSQSLINEASVATRKNAMAEAIADVIPDWMIAKRNAHSVAAASGYLTVWSCRGVLGSAVCIEPSIDQRHDLIKNRMAHTDLSRYKLDQFVRSLDIQRAVVECAGR